MSSHHALSTLVVSFATLLAACKNPEAGGNAAAAGPTAAAPPSATPIAAALPSAAPSGAPAAAASTSGRRTEIAVTADGFVAAGNKVKVGEPVTLVVTRKIDRTCAKDIVVKDYGISKPLPKDQPVEVTFTPSKPGAIPYACAMGMVTGQLVAE